MAGLKVALFGRFRIIQDTHQIEGFEGQKVRELFSYLLVFRDRPHARESLAETIWGNLPPEKSKKNLRQTLWKLKTALTDQCPPAAADLRCEPEWIQLSPSQTWWLDVAVFEQTFLSLKNQHARTLSPEHFAQLQAGADLYTGDLAEGCYRDWCLAERERYQTMYLLLLNKLVQYCEIHQDYETGLAYGERLLQHDRAYERAHRMMMRLYFQAGDRSQALRQYQRCVTALRDELGVGPSDRTIQLSEQIRSDRLHRPTLRTLEKNDWPDNLTLEDTAKRLNEFAASLTHIQAQIQQEIDSIHSHLDLSG
jgi:DNA-binding SARP family transcriptional activator